MRYVDTRTGIEVLPREECVALLADDVVGRLGVIDGGVPVILPVNYVLDGESIVLRTDHGTKLDHGTRHPASFEIDHFDRDHHAGWSVLVTGRLEEVTAFDPAFRRLDDLGVDPWTDAPKPHWLRLVPNRITGRRIRGRNDR